MPLSGVDLCSKIKSSSIFLSVPFTSTSKITSKYFFFTLYYRYREDAYNLRLLESRKKFC